MFHLTFSQPHATEVHSVSHRPLENSHEWPTLVSGLGCLEVLSTTFNFVQGVLESSWRFIAMSRIT